MTAQPTYRVILAALVIPAGVTVDAQMPRVAHQDLSHYIDDSGNVQPIRTPLDWQQRRKSILNGFQEAAGELPSRHDLPVLDFRIRVDEEFGRVRRVTGTILAEAGDRIPLDLYLPLELAGNGNSLTGPTSDKAVPGVLALHPTGAAGKRIVAGEKPIAIY